MRAVVFLEAKYATLSLQLREAKNIFACEFIRATGSTERNVSKRHFIVFELAFRDDRSH